MAYAVFKTGGKQYRVQEGDTLDIEKLEGEVDGEVQFAEVLLVNDGSATTVGTPLVEGAAVTAKVLDQFRGPKGVAFKFKRRKDYLKRQGHRQWFTEVKITGISA